MTEADNITDDQLAADLAQCERNRDSYMLHPRYYLVYLRALRVARTRIAELERERDDYKIEATRKPIYTASMQAIRDENADLRRQLDEARARLRTYGVHLVSCRSHYREVGMPSLATDCDCGLTPALAAARHVEDKNG